jgi:hypothetical protein
MENVEKIVADINAAGFEGAIAIATEAEVQAGAACGQMCLVTEAMNAE